MRKLVIKAHYADLFVPFLGDFLSITITKTVGFYHGVLFVPFLGDFLSIQSY